MNRYSMSVDRSVNDLLARVKATLTDEEIAWMSTPDTRNNEPDAYTALQNHFTQKNTDAIVKCASLRYATAVTVVIRRPTHSRSCPWAPARGEQGGQTPTLEKIRDQFIATKLDKKIIITIIKQELQFANILFDTKVHLCGIA